MASVSIANPRADVLRKAAALSANCGAARGLADAVRSNLGPRGTLKMVVGGGGQAKITKDGSVLLHEMQIQHPTASMIARAATAQDTISGDGTTSNVLFLGELVKQAERLIIDGIHPRIICDSFDLARAQAMKVADEMKVPVADVELLAVALTSLRTKLHPALCDQLGGIIMRAVECIGGAQGMDLHMVEVMHMKHRIASDTRFVRGIVMDHGTRHPDMPKRLKNCHILTCNVSLEYEKSEVNSTFAYGTASQRETLVMAERKFTDDKVRSIIELKRSVCTAANGRNFVVLNQKGIDPPSLDMLAKEGIMALRRVKRRNMERLTLCCGGNAVNAVEGLAIEDLGFAESVEETQLGEEKYTFVEGVANPRACTILIKGQNDRTIAQIKDAVRDGLHAVKNAVEDACALPGAGAFEIAAHCRLLAFAREVKGKAKLGVIAFAEALLSVPRTLTANAGLDVQEVVLGAVGERQKNPSVAVGISLEKGDPISPAVAGIWDNYRVKRQMLSLATALAQQILLVDEIIKAGKQMGGKG